MHLYLLPGTSIASMKIPLFLLLLVLAIVTCGCTDQAPDESPAPVTGTLQAHAENASVPHIIGTWSGTGIGHIQNEGFHQPAEVVFHFNEQNGYAFAGKKEYARPDGKIHSEAFSGVFSPGGDIMICDSGSGYTLGSFTGPDRMELRYAEDGDEARAYFLQLVRQKT